MENIGYLRCDIFMLSHCTPDFFERKHMSKTLRIHHTVLTVNFFNPVAPAFPTNIPELISNSKA